MSTWIAMRTKGLRGRKRAKAKGKGVRMKKEGANQKKAKRHIKKRERVWGGKVRDILLEEGKTRQ